MHIIWMLKEQLKLFFFWSSQIVTTQYGKDINHFWYNLYWEVSAITHFPTVQPTTVNMLFGYCKEFLIA